eukprot:SAG31_NODE_904_length_11120_cov_76.575084_1_plen_123_part_00
MKLCTVQILNLAPAAPREGFRKFAPAAKAEGGTVLLKRYFQVRICHSYSPSQFSHPPSPKIPSIEGYADQYYFEVDLVLLPKRCTAYTAIFLILSDFIIYIIYKFYNYYFFLFLVIPFFDKK